MTLTKEIIAHPPARSAQKHGKTRIACYERVSTEEQALHGYSIAAQRESLTAYCNAHDYVIIDHYTDEGVSGGKPADKRPAMSRLLRDVGRGLVDLILFCKLDRWFRSVTEYFKTQEILDAHGVAWNAIMEDYETETANGRMTVTIMLSVAQNERERTSERIKAVFDYRAAKGEFLSGGRAIPYGYILKDKHLEKDPAREAEVSKLFALILSGIPTGTAVSQVRQEFQSARCHARMCHMIYSPIYAGIHNGQSGYCPAYITENEHAIIMTRKGTRTPKATAIPYYFSGILCCPECGRKMRASRHIYKEKIYAYYLCSSAHSNKDCSFITCLSETRLESVLTRLLFEDGEFIVEDAKPAEKPHRTAESVPQIEQKMKRLAETYTDGLIDRETYKRKLAELTAQLDTARNAPKTHSKPHLTMGKDNLQGNLQDVYNRFTRAEKKRFWQSVILSLKVGKDYKIHDIIYAEFST